jgi:hypothetical protein
LKLRKPTLWLTLVLFLVLSGTAVAGTTQNIGLNGFLPSSGDNSITFQVADKGAEDDTTGSIVFTAASGGEFVKKLRLSDDFWVSKVHLCLAATTVATTGDVSIKIYGPDPAGTDQTRVLFEDTILQADLSECNEVVVFDPAANPPDTPITSADGPLYLSIGITGTAYIKSVTVEEFSESFEIDGCDTGVVDRLLDNGKMLSATVAECEEGPPKNHGKYVSCVAHTLNALKKSHQITGKEKGKIQRCAAKSDIGK